MACNLDLHVRSGPFSLETLSLGSFLPSRWLVSIPPSFLAYFLFPESGLFSLQVLTGLKRGKWPWAEWWRWSPTRGWLSPSPLGGLEESAYFMWVTPTQRRPWKTLPPRRLSGWLRFLPLFSYLWDCGVCFFCFLIIDVIHGYVPEKNWIENENLCGFFFLCNFSPLYILVFVFWVFNTYIGIISVYVIQFYLYTVLQLAFFS